MTAIDQIRASKAITISCVEASKVLRCKPMSLHLAAKESPQSLGFPVIMIGNHLKIPRLPFLRHLGFEEGGNADGAAALESDV